MPDTSNNHGFDLNYADSASWDYNQEFQALEERLAVRDTEANLSNYTAYAGATFIATDTGAVYDGDGTSWNHADRDLNSLSVTATGIDFPDGAGSPTQTIFKSGTDLKLSNPEGGATLSIRDNGSAWYNGSEYLEFETSLRVKPQSSSPGFTNAGTVAYADGTNWDPGSGAGFYGYDGSSWIELDNTSSGGSSGGFSQTTQTADYSASDTDSVWANASSNTVTITLPTPSQSTHVRVVAVDATNTVTVSRNGTENINGEASDRTLTEGQSETYESDGTNWWVV